MERVARKAAENVYGWLWEKQAKMGKGPWANKYGDFENLKCTFSKIFHLAKPLGDYDVERVAKKASQNVYGWMWEKQAKEAEAKNAAEQKESAKSMKK